MKFTAPLTGHAAVMRGEKAYGVTFDLGTPEADTPNPYPKRPPQAPPDNRNWFMKWLFPKPAPVCQHEWQQLGERVGIYFFQERMGWAYHYVCPKCGETKVEETD